MQQIDNIVRLLQNAKRTAFASGRLDGWTPVFSIMPLALLCLVASLVGPASSQSASHGGDAPKGGAKLKLPYSQSGSSSSCLFNLTNTAGTSNGGALYGTDQSADGSGAGVTGNGINSPGVEGISTNNYGVIGQSSNNYGILGTSNSEAGVLGIGNNAYGVSGISSSGYGVIGSSNIGYGVGGLSTTGIGVAGSSTNSYGVYGISYHNYAGYFIGNVYVTGSVSQNSDARYKTDIVTLPKALDKVLALRGVSFDWRQSAFPDMHFAKGTQIGFVAQEVEKVLPEIVSKDKKGYRGVNYTAVVPVLVEAIKEQQKTIEGLRKDVENLKAAARR